MLIFDINYFSSLLKKNDNIFLKLFSLTKSFKKNIHTTQNSFHVQCLLGNFPLSKKKKRINLDVKLGFAKGQFDWLNVKTRKPNFLFFLINRDSSYRP